MIFYRLPKNRTKPRLHRLCNNCGNRFMPVGKTNRLCECCLDKARKNRRKSK